MSEDNFSFEGNLKLRDVWQVFLEAIIRFWCNRFKKDNPALDALRLELDYRRRDFDKLLASFTELAVKRDEEIEDVDTKELKPIRNIQPSWSYRAQMFEQKKREEAKQNSRQNQNKMSPEEIEELENEVGVNS